MVFDHVLGRTVIFFFQAWGGVGNGEEAVGWLVGWCVFLKNEICMSNALHSCLLMTDALYCVCVV